MAEEKDAAGKAAETEKKPAAKKPATKSTSASASKPAAKKPAAAKSTSASAEKKPAAKKPAATKSASASGAAAKSDAKATTAAAAKKAPATKPKAAEPETAEPRERVLKVHHLRPAPGAKKDRTRVGRGEASKGKTAGRGTKGTKARYQVRPGFEGGQLPYHMRTPKLRGFNNPFRVEYQVVNLDKLAKLYPSGGDVTVGDLVAKGAVRKNERVKVLGDGEITVKLNVTVDKISGSAEQKIVAAGGTVQK